MSKIIRVLLWSMAAVSLLVFVFVWISMPEASLLNIIVTGVTFVLCLGVVLSEHKHLAESHNRLRWMKLFNASLSGFLLLGILGLINYVAYKHPISKDLSAGGFSSLSAQSQQVLKDSGKIAIRIYATPGQYEQLKFLIELYRRSRPDLSIEFVDTQTRPDLVKAKKILQSPTIEIVGAKRTERILSFNEQTITQAIFNVSRQRNPYLCFDSETSQNSIADTGPNGLSFLLQALQQNYLTVRIVQLSKIETLSDCQGIVIWGPRKSLLPKAIENLQQLLKRGERVLIGIDPQLNGDPLSDLRSLLLDYEIRVENNLIVDPKMNVNGSQGSVPLVSQYGRHPIVNGMKGQTFFPLTSSISLLNNEDSLLFQSGPQSWGETNFKEFVDGPLQFDELKDAKGPLGMAVARSIGEKGGIVVFGNSTFISNQYRSFPNNFLLFINTASWLSSLENLIQFDRPLLKEVPVFIAPMQVRVVFYFSVIVLPLLLIGISFFCYRRRSVL